MRGLYLGIDLGTTNSKAAYMDYRGVDAADPVEVKIKQRQEPNDEVNWSHLPSVVRFEQDGTSVQVGEVARRYISKFPERTVKSVKRLMGKSWKYTVEGWEEVWSPEAISAILLRYLREQTLEYLHDTSNDLTSVAISVPASFGSRQRQATVDAARMAGFSGTVNLIDEPSAALIDYVYDQWQKGNDFSEKTRVLVYDMGGGTLDVSIAQIDPTQGGLRLQILSRSRYTEMAGTEFDLRLAAHVIHQWQQNGMPILKSERDRKNLFRSVLFEMAEPLKVEMSKLLNDRYRWSFNRQGLPFDLEDGPSIRVSPRQREILLGREIVELPDLGVPVHTFLDILEPFFNPDDPNNPQGLDTIYGPMFTALEEAGLAQHEIDIVLLHGGMAQLRPIQVGIMSTFPEIRTITTTPNPMTSVARGAALYQASRDGRVREIEVVEPALFESIYVETKHGFELTVDKNAQVGDEGTYQLVVPASSKRIRLSLYHGFSESDPLLDYDRMLRIDLPDSIEPGEAVELRWVVNGNRTVTFEWRCSATDSQWKPFSTDSRHQGLRQSMNDSRRSERAVERVRFA